MEVIINPPYTVSWQGHRTRNFFSADLASLPSRESPVNSTFTYYQQISPSCSRPTRFETRTLDHLSSVTVNNRHCNGIQPGRKPSDRTVCVAVYLSTAFDTVCHNNLLLKINRSQLPPALAPRFSCYLRGRQSKTCFRCVKSTFRKVNTGVQQGSKLSPSLFSFYIAQNHRSSQSGLSR